MPLSPRGAELPTSQPVNHSGKHLTQELLEVCRCAPDIYTPTFDNSHTILLLYRTPWATFDVSVLPFEDVAKRHGAVLLFETVFDSSLLMTCDSC